MKNVITPEEFKTLFPQACAWAENQERKILMNGVQLSPAQIIDAKERGVAHPEKVRLLKVKLIPLPDGPALRAAAEAAGLNSATTVGQTFRYGIFIREDVWNRRDVLAHELSHTSQYERLGGIQQFLQQYLHECNTLGYANAPLEKEALAGMERFRD